jgi:hypothetical protein
MKVFVFRMKALELVFKGMILFIVSSTILVVLSVPLSVYRIINFAALSLTVLLIIGVLMLGVHLFAKRAK